MTNSVEYLTWCAIKRRCYNKNEPCYARYGGKGIRVHESWVNSFENFYRDMGPRPEGGFSIERIDPLGDYSPDNCKWIPFLEQNNNRSDTVRLEAFGERHITSVWSKRFGVPYATIQSRIRNGWSVERAISEPVNKSRRNSLSTKV